MPWNQQNSKRSSRVDEFINYGNSLASGKYLAADTIRGCNHSSRFLGVKGLGLPIWLCGIGRLPAQGERLTRELPPKEKSWRQQSNIRIGIHSKTDSQLSGHSTTVLKKIV